MTCYRKKKEVTLDGSVYDVYCDASYVVAVGNFSLGGDTVSIFFLLSIFVFSIW